VLVDIFALTIVVCHFVVPLTYYVYMKRKIRIPWNIKVNNDYLPKVTVILPTYNEVEIIKERLENLRQQDYPRHLMEIIVADSSNDGTAEVVENWSETNGMNIQVIKESERRGKLYDLNSALRHVSLNSDVVVFTDADVIWEPKALSKAVRYLADPRVGAVTANILYEESKFLENVYRNYYNIVRIAESKIHSTPIHNGPFLVIKAQLLREVGLPMFPGSDDSAFGSFIAFMGYRAIELDEITIKEPIRGNQIIRRIRRAQHLLLNFIITKRYTKERGLYKKTEFDRTWKIEWWLHIVNPWFLLISIALFGGNILLYRSVVSLGLLTIGLVLLISKSFTMWVLQQLYLMIAAVRNLWTRDVVWRR
jgi:glycosyltransferase involved in cell wall biosynthesis